MKTTIYLIRHSIPFKEHMGTKLVNDDLLSWNMKNPLSVKGEKLARDYFDKSKFKKVDVVFSSSYVRAMATAKYLAYQNDLLVNVNSCFDERIHGINDWSELPKNFELRQFIDPEYKIGNGESRLEVMERMLNGLDKILEEYRGKNIAIVGHATAFAFLLYNWCLIDSNNCYYYQDKIIFDGVWDYLETFKLTFDEEKRLVDIENIDHI